MKIKNHIRSLSKLQGFLKDNQGFYMGINNIENLSKELIKIGFSKELKIGEKLLPKEIGKYTSVNAEGYNIVRKDLPKETHYRQAEWKWKQWAGRGYYDDMSKIVDVPYERYPREKVPPYSEELEIVDSNKKEIVITREFIYKKDTEEVIINTINLLIECFGECTIFNSKLTPIVKSKTIRLNWEILPPGKYPWKEVEKKIEKLNENISEGLKPVINYRIECITKFEPDIFAYGKNGFNGYYIFGFTKRKLYILESNKKDNATYVLSEDWESLSKLTKAELLSDNLHEYRFIHREGWESHIKRLLK